MWPTLIFFSIGLLCVETMWPMVIVIRRISKSFRKLLWPIVIGLFSVATLVFSNLGPPTNWSPPPCQNVLPQNWSSILRWLTLVALKVLEWAHGNLVSHVYNPPHSSRPQNVVGWWLVMISAWEHLQPTII